MAKRMPLVKLRRGEKALVAELPADKSRLQKLLVFGVLPGTEIEMLQVFPGYVLAVGNTMLALDKEIAGSILVMKKV